MKRVRLTEVFKIQEAKGKMRYVLWVAEVGSPELIVIDGASDPREAWREAFKVGKDLRDPYEDEDGNLTDGEHVLLPANDREEISKIADDLRTWGEHAWQEPDQLEAIWPKNKLGPMPSETRKGTLYGPSQKN
jgi:hypothetical protein